MLQLPGAMGQIFLQVHQFSCDSIIPPTLHIYSLIHSFITNAVQSQQPTASMNKTFQKESNLNKH